MKIQGTSLRKKTSSFFEGRRVKNTGGGKRQGQGAGEISLKGNDEMKKEKKTAIHRRAPYADAMRYTTHARPLPREAKRE